MSFYPRKTPDLSKKRNAQIARAQRRAKERLGAEIDTQAIAAQIRRMESRFLFAQNNRLTIHEVEIDGKPVRVVYDKTRKVVVTILPRKEE